MRRPAPLSWAVLPILFAALLPALAGCSPPPLTATPAGHTTASARVFPTPVPSPTPPPPVVEVVAPAVGPFDFSRTGPGGSIQRTGNAAVALTFDDGPDPVYTPLFLDMLANHHVTATFCLVGHRAAENPAIVARIVAEGHTLCNHSWNHATDLATWSDEAILDDLRRTNAAIEAAVPGTTVHYFRAPGGNFTTHLVALANSLGMEGLDWEIDPKDWNSAAFGTGQPMVNHLVDVLSRWTYPGTIILSHDLAKPDTLAAYDTLIPIFQAKQFVLVSLPPVPPAYQ